MLRQSDINLPPVRAAYGLDLGEGFAAVVHTRATRTGLVEETVLETRTQDLKTALTACAQRVHAEVLLHKALLAAALPAQDSMVQWLEAPFPSMAKARKVLPSLLDIQLPFPLETCVHGFPLLESADADRVRALAVAARKENIEARIAACADLNMDPQCLDHEGLALWTQSLAEQPADHGLRVVTYLGVDRTVWALGEGDRLLNAHASRTGAAHLTKTASDAPDTVTGEWRDRAVRNVRAQLAKLDASRVQWYWTGPGAADRNLVATLEQILQHTEKRIAFTAHQRPATFLARALAARALQQTQPGWNYRFGEFAHPTIARWRDRALRHTAWTALAAGLALCVFNLVFGAFTEVKNRNADRALARSAQAITGLPSVPRGQERMMVERAVEEQDEQLAPFRRAFHTSLTEPLHRLLQQGQAGGLRYESITVRDDQLLVQGAAENWDGCEVLAQSLRDDGWTVNLERQDAVAMERVRFRLTAGRDS